MSLTQRYLFPDCLDDPFPPDQPTDSLPGTPDKVDVLAARLRARQALWYPRDVFDPERLAKEIRVLRNGRPVYWETVEE